MFKYFLLLRECSKLKYMYTHNINLATIHSNHVNITPLQWTQLEDQLVDQANSKNPLIHSLIRDVCTSRALRPLRQHNTSSSHSGRSQQRRQAARTKHAPTSKVALCVLKTALLCKYTRIQVILKLSKKDYFGTLSYMH